jgi:hypothetical protein
MLFIDFDLLLTGKKMPCIIIIQGAIFFGYLPYGGFFA